MSCRARKVASRLAIRERISSSSSTTGVGTATQTRMMHSKHKHSATMSFKIRGTPAKDARLCSTAKTFSGHDKLGRLLCPTLWSKRARVPTTRRDNNVGTEPQQKKNEGTLALNTHLQGWSPGAGKKGSSSPRTVQRRELGMDILFQH